MLRNRGRKSGKPALFYYERSNWEGWGWALIVEQKQNIIAAESTTAGAPAWLGPLQYERAWFETRAISQRSRIADVSAFAPGA